MTSPYPHIDTALLTMLIDNGCVTRFEPAEIAEARITRWIEDYTTDHRIGDITELPSINAWLATLTPNGLSTLIGGECQEVDEILSTSPVGTRELLDNFYDEFIA